MLEGSAYIFAIPFNKVSGIHLLNKQEVLKTMSPDEFMTTVKTHGFTLVAEEGDVLFLPNDMIYYNVSVGCKYARWSFCDNVEQHLVNGHNNYERIFAAYPQLRQTSYKRWGMILTALATS